VGRLLSRKVSVLCCRRRHRLICARAGVTLGIAGIFHVRPHSSLQTAVAEGDTRTLSFHHLHTGEDITITFKRDGRYDDAR